MRRRWILPAALALLCLSGCVEEEAQVPSAWMRAGLQSVIRTQYQSPIPDAPDRSGPLSYSGREAAGQEQNIYVAPENIGQGQDIPVQVIDQAGDMAAYLEEHISPKEHGGIQVEGVNHVLIYVTDEDPTRVYEVAARAGLPAVTVEYAEADVSMEYLRDAVAELEELDLMRGTSARPEVDSYYVADNKIYIKTIHATYPKLQDWVDKYWRGGVVVVSQAK